MIRWRDYNIVPTIGLYNNKQSHWTDKGGYISLTLTQMKDYKSFNTGYTYSYSRDNYVSSEVFIEDVYYPKTIVIIENLVHVLIIIKSVQKGILLVELITDLVT